MVNISRFSLEGKVALVTGGSRGIGRAAALGFAEAGADVVISSRKQEDLEKTAEEIRGKGRKAIPIAAHLGRLDQITSLVEKVMGEFGRIDILVNNAGTAPALASILEAEEKLWDSVFNLNLKGLYFMSQAVARKMKDLGGGAIINTASIDGFRPQKNVGIYSISKAAVVMATKSMAYELAPYNIRVNAIAPGFVDTKMLNSNWAHLTEEQAGKEKASMMSQIPLQRFAKPDEMAGAMIFLASDASGYITGETIIIDGGELLSKH
jgi:NAD(P)-dependent dehydrogenase (short-subunit alcohol dehydrogenase family)